MSWQDQEFPVWESYEIYEDNYELYRSLTHGYDKENVPDKLKENTKYNVFKVWFKISESGKVEGPFDSRNGEKI